MDPSSETKFNKFLMVNNNHFRNIILGSIFVVIVNLTMWMMKHGNQHCFYVISHAVSFCYLLILLRVNHQSDKQHVFFGFSLHYIIFNITEIAAFCLYFDPKHENYTEFHQRLLLSQYLKFLIYCQLVVPSFNFHVSFPLACLIFGSSHFGAALATKTCINQGFIGKYLFLVLWQGYTCYQNTTVLANLFFEKNEVESSRA